MSHVPPGPWLRVWPLSSQGAGNRLQADAQKRPSEAASSGAGSSAGDLDLGDAGADADEGPVLKQKKLTKKQREAAPVVPGSILTFVAVQEGHHWAKEAGPPRRTRTRAGPGQEWEEGGKRRAGRGRGGQAAEAVEPVPDHNDSLGDAEVEDVGNAVFGMGVDALWGETAWPHAATRRPSLAPAAPTPYGCRTGSSTWTPWTPS